DFSVYTNGVRVWGPSEFAVARHMALREVICASERPGAISAVLHAGAVAKNGKAVVLAGDSGAGKTTLLTSLILAGWDYMADDLTGLDREGREIWSFPVAISLKSGSAALLASHLAEVPDLSCSPPDEFGLRYLDASARRAETPRVRVGLLCFVQYDAACTSLEVETLSPTAALGMLLQSGTRVVGAPPTVAALARLLDEVPSYRVRYADRQEATAFLEARVGEP
ncbi:MAG: hypothetical protein C0519_16435, partial [Hyphomicrobium sp.]|nr:hypothetical protein [Hyphomicrobium sp.]